MGLTKLARSAKWHAIRAAFVAWLASTVVLGVTLLAPWPWAGAFIPDNVFAIIVTSMVVCAVAVIALPLSSIGQYLVVEIRGTHANGRLRNVAEEIAVAVGETADHVLIHDSKIPNVGAFPTKDGIVMLATTGAVEQLRRDELQALVAAQLAGMEDRWCQVATRAELLWGFAKAAGILAFVISPLAFAPSILLFMLPRSVEASRDLCADVAAVNATRDPTPLASGLRHLKPSTAVADAQSLVGKRFLPINPFLVLPQRNGAARTTITVGGKVTRSYTEAELASAELDLRAERAEAMATGGDPRKFTGREYLRRSKNIGKVQPTDEGSDQR